jgi:hypothetical protein
MLAFKGTPAPRGCAGTCCTRSTGRRPAPPSLPCPTPARALANARSRASTRPGDASFQGDGAQALPPRDVDHLKLAVQFSADYVSVPFVRSAADVQQARFRAPARARAAGPLRRGGRAGGSAGWVGSSRSLCGGSGSDAEARMCAFLCVRSVGGVRGFLSFRFHEGAPGRPLSHAVPEERPRPHPLLGLPHTHTTNSRP